MIANLLEKTFCCKCQKPATYLHTNIIFFYTSFKSYCEEHAQELKDKREK